MTAYQQFEQARAQGKKDGLRGTPGDLMFADDQIGDAYRRGYDLGKETAAHRKWAKQCRAASKAAA